MRSICVFCGSNLGNNPVYVEGAKHLGYLLADKGLRLIYGGADRGIMGEIANSVLTNGGEVIGVMPLNTASTEIPHKQLTELIMVDSLDERKSMMFNLSDGFIALPGGIGTLYEFSDIITLRLYGLHCKPFGLLNINQYYDNLISHLDRAVEEGFMKQKYRDLILCESSPEELIDKLLL